MSEPKTKNTAPVRGSKASIFVVDDEPMLLELARIILEPQGYRLKLFRDPEEALEAFGKTDSRPELLITDYAMHTMNGMQLVERFRLIAPKQRILLLSGTVGSEVFSDSPAKPDGFLAKPYQPQQLTLAVEAMLGKAKG